MPKDGIRSTYSQCPFQIRMYDDSGFISTGTAFFFACADDWFLITNWHNVSGKNFISKGPLSKERRLPTYIEAHISSYIDLAKKHFTTVSHRIEIYENYGPVWFEHPQLGSLCDVVALPIRRPQHCPNFMHNAANLISKTKIPVKPGCTAFVIGFPRSISVGFGLPLWKSGYIASEPHYDITIGGELSSVGGLKGGTDLPCFFIDTQTREGMSGAPVFAAFTGTWDMSDPYTPIDLDAPDFWTRNDIAMGHFAMEFVGCYSGRVGVKEEGAALGLCWRLDVLELICSSRVLGKHPHVN